MKGEDYVGHIVEWSSQAKGTFKVKRGLVLEYIPPNCSIQYECDGDYIGLLSKRSRLLVYVKGRLYTPIGRSNGEFPNVKVVDGLSREDDL